MTTNQPASLEWTKAIELVTELNSDPGEDWLYVAVSCPINDERGIIEIYDEDQEFVGTL